MLQLNETLITLDPAEALADEAGVFEVTSPGGEQYQLISRRGRSITNIRSVEKSAVSGNWQIRKVAEISNAQETSA